MDIMSLLKKRTEYPIDMYNDAWLTQLVDSDEETFCIVTTESALNARNPKNKQNEVLQKYYLKAMFDLKNPYAGTDTDFILYVFSKKPSETVAYGIYFTSLKSARFHGCKLPKLELKDVLSDEYVEYLNRTDSFLSDGKLPEGTENCEFGLFPFSQLDLRYCIPKHYCKKVQETYKSLESKKTLPLGDVAKIIEPKPIGDGVALTLSPSAQEYPIDYGKLTEGKKTKYPLQKGDILFFDRNNMFLVYEQPVKEIHASGFCKIIRSVNADFCPEYLYCYLRSEAISTILESRERSSFARLRITDLLKLPVAVPEKESLYYTDKFYSENFSYGYVRENRITEEAAKNTESAAKSRFVPYCGEKEYIFISYCHKDKEQVLPIIQKLFEKGYRVWYDEGIDPGTEWDKNIAEHIVNCGYFIAFMTENYLGSSNCKDELNFARELEKNRFLIYLEKISLPPEMQMRLGRIQNIHKYAYENDEDFFEKLMNAKDLEKHKN